MKRPFLNRMMLSLLVSVLLAGCAKSTIPMEMARYPQESDKPEKNLMILLRGIGGDNESFEEHGLIDEIRKRNLPYDIIAPNAHFGYYRNESAQDRIYEDIVLPARQAGYKRIWLAGFSMGGLGSLFYLERYAKSIDGVMLICPFVGWKSIIDEIREKGGLDLWDKTTDVESDWQRFIWSFIKLFKNNQNNYPPVYLGYGNFDLLTGSGPSLLATALPQGKSFEVEGGHTYGTFRKVFLAHLDNLDTVLKGEGNLSVSATEAKRTNPE